RVNRCISSATAMYRLIALEDLNKKLFLVERRARAIGPLKSELAVILLQIAPPQLFAREIKCRQVTIAVIEHYNFAVGHGRRRGEVAFLIKVIAHPNLLIPEDFPALAVEAKRSHRFRPIISR